jgi:hypothetical protein
MKRSLKKAISFILISSVILSAAMPVFAERPTYITDDTYYRNNMDYYTGEALNGKTKSPSLSLIKGFDTYLQNQSYTCGCVAAMMTEHYYSGCNMDEDKVAELMEAMGSTADYGTDTISMRKYFDDMGWSTEVNYINEEDAPDEGLNPKVDGVEKPYEALEFLKNNVDNGIPTIVEWIDWGGHWQVVVGYDDNGTNDFSTKNGIRDDVIIMADPADKTDHNWDGYYVVPAARFLYMWYDDYCLVRNPSSAKFNNPDYGYYDYLSNWYVSHPFLIVSPPAVIANVEGATGAAVTITEDELRSDTGAGIRLVMPLHTGREFVTENVDTDAFSIDGAPPDTEITGIYEVGDDTVVFHMSCATDFSDDYEMTVTVSADAVSTSETITSNVIRIKAFAP